MKLSIPHTNQSVEVLDPPTNMRWEITHYTKTPDIDFRVEVDVDAVVDTDVWELHLVSQHGHRVDTQRVNQPETFSVSPASVQSAAETLIHRRGEWIRSNRW